MSGKTAEDENRFHRIGDYWLSQKPNSPNWHRTWFDKESRQTKRSSLGTDDIVEAEKALVQFLAKNPKLDRKDPATITLHTVLMWYWDNHGKKIPSRVGVKTAIAYLGDYFPTDVTVADLNQNQMNGFVEALRKHDFKPGYIRRICNVASAALNRARRYGMISHVPVLSDGMNVQEVIAKTEPKGRPISLEEMAKLFIAARHDCPRVFYIDILMTICLHTLCRPGAALELTKSQVDFDANIIHLNQAGRVQTNKRRPVIPLTPELKSALIAWEQKVMRRARAQGRPDYIFDRYIIRQNLQPIHTFYGGFKSVYEASSLMPLTEDTRVGRYIDHISLYSIRHTMARELRIARLPTEDISAMLGHTNADTNEITLVYAPFDPEYLREPAKVISAYWTRLETEIAEQMRVRSVSEAQDEERIYDPTF
jgi:integrase